MNEREKIARHIIEFGIRMYHHEVPGILDVKEWQNEIATKPFNLKQASEYLGISAVTLRRWIKAERISAYKIGRASVQICVISGFGLIYLEAEIKPYEPILKALARV